MASDTITESEAATAAEDMELENPQPGATSAIAAEEEDEAANVAANGDSTSKREREAEEAEEEGNGGIEKKQKLDKSVEEERLEKLEEREDGGEEKVGEEEQGEKLDLVSIGPKTFESSLEMFNYFFKFLHHWSPNINVNKYEHMVLLDLIKKGHPDPEKKIGVGAKAFQIRNHPEYKSRCFFIIRSDDSADDFSFRKCVDHILPLPENMQAKRDVNKVLGGDRSGKRGGGGGSRGRGRGRGGYFRR